MSDVTFGSVYEIRSYRRSVSDLSGKLIGEQIVESHSMPEEVLYFAKLAIQLGDGSVIHGLDQIKAKTLAEAFDGHRAVAEHALEEIRKKMAAELKAREEQKTKAEEKPGII